MDKAIEELQNEMKVLKNEIKETLTDVREYLLTNAQNPFPVELSRELPTRQAAIERPAERPPDVKTRPELGEGASSGGMGQPLAPGVVGGVGMSGLPVGSVAPQVNPFGQFGPVVWPAAPPPIAPMGSVDTRDRAEAAKAGDNGHDHKAPAVTAKPAAAGSASGETAAELAEQQAVQDNHHEAEDLAEEEVSEAPVVENKARPQNKKMVSATKQDGMTSLVTVAMLASWMEDSIRRVGKERLKVILDIYYLTGSLSQQHRDLSFQLMNLSNGKDPVNKEASLKTCLRVMADLDNLLRRSRTDPDGAALLSMLLNSK